MKTTRIPLLLLLLAFVPCLLEAQCVDPIVADSSFEVGTYEAGPFPYIPGFWYRDDGCLISQGGYAGDSSACSIGGGAFQFIRVDSNTTYHLSCYALNAATDDYPSFRINWGFFPISTPSNNWSLISQSFNSGSDTIAIVGFYSAGACFDEFRVTCSPIVTNPKPTASIPPHKIYPTVSANHFTIESQAPSEVTILNLSGQVVDRFRSHGQARQFGHALPPSLYTLQIQFRNQLVHYKIVKQ